jgi:hypothetical protein
MDLIIFLLYAMISFLVWMAMGLAGGILYSYDKGLAWILCIVGIVLLVGWVSLTMGDLTNELSTAGTEKVLGAVFGGFIFWPAFSIGANKIYPELTGRN